MLGMRATNRKTEVVNYVARCSRGGLTREEEGKECMHALVAESLFDVRQVLSTVWCVVSCCVGFEAMCARDNKSLLTCRPDPPALALENMAILLSMEGLLFCWGLMRLSSAPSQTCCHDPAEKCSDTSSVFNLTGLPRVLSLIFV